MSLKIIILIKSFVFRIYEKRINSRKDAQGKINYQIRIWLNSLRVYAREKCIVGSNIYSNLLKLQVICSCAKKSYRKVLQFTEVNFFVGKWFHIQMKNCKKICQGITITNHRFIVLAGLRTKLILHQLFLTTKKNRINDSKMMCFVYYITYVACSYVFLLYYLQTASLKLWINLFMCVHTVQWRTYYNTFNLN